MTEVDEFGAATLRLVPESGDRYTIHLTSPLAGPETIITRSGFSRLQTLYGQARDSLEQYTLKGRLELRQRPDVAASILNQFRGLGRLIMTTLVGRLSGPDAHDFRQFFKKVATSSPAARSVLDIVSPVDVPFELIPALWDETEIIPASDAGLADQVTSRFLGVRFVIHRFGDDRRERPLNRELHKVPASHGAAVPVAPYWHERIGQVREELAALGQLASYAVREPQPDRRTATAAEPERGIAAMLVRDRPEREEIVHITAHCDTKSGSVAEHCIVLAARAEWRTHPVRITVGQLKGAEELTACESPAGPLAFISACGAADLEFTSPTSIPEVLLDANYRAVVSPLVSIHVEPARVFAHYFYSALSEKRTVAGALRAARLNLVRYHGNPLGLAYCCHGESRLRIAE